MRYLTRSLPKGSVSTEAKAEWCNVLQLLRLEVRYHRYSGFSGGVDHTPDTQAGLVRGSYIRSQTSDHILRRARVEINPDSH